ncbi:dTMP kinase [Glacieibacterium sp.]|uniref:dTMP kinase n=1 Tax=Glacieibacterium sp. TaxID=2860237 RepID=UPI003B00C8BD
MRQARFITLEGGEGSGKSTQVALLAERLRERGIEVVTTREPGGTEGAEAIRELLVTGSTDRWSPAAEALLVNAGRADHVERLIRPALAAGKWVISDRFADSTMAYQGAGKGLSDASLRSLHHLSAADLWPDLTLVLDLPVELGLSRAASRAGGEGRFEQHDADFHQRVSLGFRDLAAAEPRRCRLIDADGDPASVSSRIWGEVMAMDAVETVLERNPGELAGNSGSGTAHLGETDTGDD